MKKNVFDKMLDFCSLESYCQQCREHGERIALCHGCFDPIHLGHIFHFIEASNLADHLIITITPDMYVNKGENRPYFSAQQRLIMIASLEYVDKCAINLWPTAVETIRRLLPNYYVKGIDYLNCIESDPGLHAEFNAINETNGIMYFTKTKKYSSTDLVGEGIIPLFGGKND